MNALDRINTRRLALILKDQLTRLESVKDGVTKGPMLDAMNNYLDELKVTHKIIEHTPVTSWGDPLGPTTIKDDRPVPKYRKIHTGSVRYPNGNRVTVYYKGSWRKAKPLLRRHQANEMKGGVLRFDMKVQPIQPLNYIECSFVVDDATVNNITWRSLF